MPDPSIHPSNVRQDDWIYLLRIAVTLEEAEALAVGTIPATVGDALRVECAEKLPVLRGETMDVPRRMPKQKPHRSVQEVQTPPEFLAAVKRFLRIEAFAIDLAASAENTAADRFYSKADNALLESWVYAGWGWLNPEYTDIAPWVERACGQAQQGAKVAMLVPAAVGSNWWRDFVHEKAAVLLLNGRIKFVGHEDYYQNDCALVLYGSDYPSGYSVWQWAKAKRRKAA